MKLWRACVCVCVCVWKLWNWHYRGWRQQNIDKGDIFYFIAFSVFQYYFYYNVRVVVDRRVSGDDFCHNQFDDYPLQNVVSFFWLRKITMGSFHKFLVTQYLWTTTKETRRKRRKILLLLIYYAKVLTALHPRQFHTPLPPHTNTYICC